jgi:SET domain
MRRGVPLMVGISEIPNAGFGVFSKHDLAAGTFLGEYVGEIISQDEAERRGHLYDMRNHSCLFNFSSDLVVDADARGSRLRFLNHSKTPNCEPKFVNVAGGTRIAFFTLKKVAAQTELTFNYSYDELSSPNCASFIHRSASVAETAKEKWFRDTVTEDANEVKRSDNAASRNKRKSRPSKRNTINNAPSLTAAVAKKMDCKPPPYKSKSSQPGRHHHHCRNNGPSA